MAKLRINGDTSGYVDITVPAVAGERTLDVVNPSFAGSVTARDTVNLINTAAATGTEWTSISNYSDGNFVIARRNDDGSYRGNVLVGWADGSTGLATGNNGTERLRIDTSGRITAPSQTSCIAYLGSDQSISANTWTKVNLNQTTFNVGNNFNTSNGRFVAPVSGRYFVGYTVNFNSGGFSGYLYSGIQINGSFTFYGEGRNSSASWNGDNTLGNGQLVNLTANDFVELYAYSAGTNSLASGTVRTHLSVHLLS